MDRDRAKVIELRIRREEVVARVRELAAKGLVAFSDHAYDQMDERSLNDLIALRVLQKGDPKGDVEPGREAGEWKVKMVDRVKGSRDVGVVTVLLSNRKMLRVLTVEWEDL